MSLEEHSAAPPGSETAATPALAAAAVRDPGFALLYELVRREEMDPWDIDVIEVTDRYLEALRAEDHLHLVRCARCIFYAAALVHMKARILALGGAQALVVSELLGEDDYGDEGFDAAGPEEPVEGSARPSRAPVGLLAGLLLPRDRQPRQRSVTIDDLIRALRALDDRLERRAAAAEDYLDEDEARESCIGNSHQDDLQGAIAALRALLERVLAESDASDAGLLDVAPPARAARFLALLFLASQEEVTLEQETLYGPLSIRKAAAWGQVEERERELASASEEAADGALEVPLSLPVPRAPERARLQKRRLAGTRSAKMRRRFTGPGRRRGPAPAARQGATGSEAAVPQERAEPAAPTARDLAGDDARPALREEV